MPVPLGLRDDRRYVAPPLRTVVLQSGRLTLGARWKLLGLLLKVVFCERLKEAAYFEMN
jgi:hypothetical protein